MGSIVRARVSKVVQLRVQLRKIGLRVRACGYRVESRHLQLTVTHARCYGDMGTHLAVENSREQELGVVPGTQECGANGTVCAQAAPPWWQS